MTFTGWWATVGRELALDARARCNPAQSLDAADVEPIARAAFEAGRR